MSWWREGVLYQIYPRSFADSNGDGIGDLRGITSRLDHLQWLGIDGIWLNPTMPSPNDDWGYDVADYCAVHPDLGTLEDLDELVAEAGRRGIRVLLDLVPDLNWWSDAVRDDFDRILRFWYERGIAGFRIDVCHAIVNDRELRDDPAATPDDHPKVFERGLKSVFSMNRPEVHDVLKRWRRLSGDRILVGETYVLDVDQLIPYYGTGEDQLHLAFNFLFVHAEFSADDLRPIVEAIEAKLPVGAWPVWTGSNHDAGRLATRWAGGDEAKARCALLMLLTLRGTPFLYYGDEIGLPEVDVPEALRRDPVPSNRDGCRTPMPWTGEPWPDAWLPMGDTARNVAAQRDDPGSVLHLVRDLIALRRDRADLRAGGYETQPAPAGAWIYRRGDRTTVALNLSDEPVAIDSRGTVLIATKPFDGTLAPWAGVVLDG
jgi:alpha-glucosidase